MKKYLLVISDYKDWRQAHFLKYHSPRNKQYCEHHGFEYLEILNMNDIPDECKKYHVFFYRHFYIKHLINTGFLKEGDIISHIDADVCIVNGNYPLQPPDKKSFAYAIDSCNTHCMGAFSIRLTDWGINLNKNFTDDNRITKFMNKTFFWQLFWDQACWYSMAGIDTICGDPNQISWEKFPHLGWHSTKENDPIYSLEELYQNVEILPVEWNITVWNSPNVYLRFRPKTNNREDVIFRHFAGGSGSVWESDWCNIPLFKKS